MQLLVILHVDDNDDELLRLRQILLYGKKKVKVPYII